MNFHPDPHAPFWLHYVLLLFINRVMVLERGELVEYASPLELLNDPNSLFYALCKKTGALEQLKETARIADEENRRRRERDIGDQSLTSS